MLETTSSPLFILFVVACLLGFFWPFVRNAVGKQIAITSFRSTWPAFAVMLVFFAILFLGTHLLNYQIANTFFYFAGGAVLVYVLAGLNIPPRLAGVLLLSASVALATKSFGADGTALIAAGAGALVWKLVQSFYDGSDLSIADIMPSLVFIFGLNFIAGSSTPADIPIKQGMLLGALAVVLIFRILETPFLDDDRIYLKRLVLSSTAGLGFLIVMTKLLMVPSHFDMYALLFGAGVFISYLLQNAKAQSKSVYGFFYVLALIGIATLVAWRLFGGLGLVLLASASLVGRSEESSEFIGLFWISRVLLQVFIVNYVANVTGINTTHPYVGAALYGGMLFIILVSLMMRDFQNKRIFVSLLGLSVTAIPFLLDYFLHAEACASFLQASLVQAVLLAVIAPVLYRQEKLSQGSILLVPAAMTSLAILGNELFSAGNDATLTTKITVMSYALTAFIVLSIVPWKLFGHAAGKPVDVSRDS